MKRKKTRIIEATIAGLAIGASLGTVATKEDASLREESKDMLQVETSYEAGQGLLAGCLISKGCSVSIITTVPVTGRGAGC